MDFAEFLDDMKKADAFKTVDTCDIVTTVSYLLGQRDEIYHEHYPDYIGLVSKLKENVNANKIRYLCKLRTALLKNFKKTDVERKQLIPIDRMAWFDPKEIAQLRKWGIELVLANKMAKDYAYLFNELIDKNIDACKPLFPEWLNFDFIRDLFVIPKYNKSEVLVAEFEKYQGNKTLYPFQFYIHWNPVDEGNIFIADSKFLKILYAQHGEEFTDFTKCHDANEGTKRSIYDFINDAEHVIICVDCENSDPYKLYGALYNLDKEQTAKINKIVLYDDIHTSRAWDYIGTTTHIPVEHIEVERVVGAKSLVDLRMTAGVCKSHYKEHIDSFILCSSDSDFWGLISTLDDAQFLVMYEYDKCGKAIKDALDTKKIFHCSLDDFFSGNAQKLQEIVLKKELESRLPDIVGRDAWLITKELFSKARISVPDSEMRVFYNKYVKTLKLKIGPDGAFVIEIAA